VLSVNDFVLSYLQEERIVSPEAMAAAQRHASANGITAHEALLATKAISARDLAIARASVAECCYIDLAAYDIDLGNAAHLPRNLAERLAAFVLFRLSTVAVVAMADPTDLKALDRIRAALKGDVEVVQCEPSALATLISRAYSMQGAGETLKSLAARDADLADQHALASDPIVSAVNQILEQGLEQGASDIHLNPDERELFLRYRIDGSLQQRQGPPLASHPALVQRIKVMASLDLTQTRRPQDGKFRFVHHDRNVDVRVSIIPTINGENVVLRLLAGDVLVTDFVSLGFSTETARQFDELFERPHGMIVVSGPTGSGKTTTLYTGLQRVNTPDRNVVAIEDPVEIRLPMVRHVQVHAEIGLTFASALRSILRQDPDVILVGEIRDEETARIALQAALTGHLVLSTVHTNDAPSTIARLVDFGCPVFAVNTALLCVLAQRLVRRVCPHCVAAYEPSALLMKRFAVEGGQFRHGAGCPRCSNSGYRGRVAAYELLVMSTAIQEAIESKASSAALRRLALRHGMKPMWADALDKARLGITTLEEITEIAASALQGDLEAMADSARVRLSA
jgi:type IV pilus assembly protein PilB